MKVESLLRRGNMHSEYCEDAIFHTTINDEWIIGSVMDGCSSAKESYFASILFSKLIKKACKSLPIFSQFQTGLEFSELSPKYLGEYILNQVRKDIKTARKQIQLDKIEILSTLLIVVANIKTRQAWVNVSGDGYIEIDNNLIEIDQNNIPDYLGYHIDMPFKEWLNNHSKSYEFKEFSQLSIATDGIDKFMDRVGTFPKNINSPNILLSVNSKNRLNLDAAMAVLEYEHKLSPFDDIGIIRIY